VRLLALWLVLFAAYAATIGLRSGPGAEYGGDEPHHLLVAESIVSDRDFDLRDEYASRAYGAWRGGPLRPGGRAPVRGGPLREPQGLGLGLLIAPAYELGGPRLVEGFLAAIAALGFVLAALLARRIVPEPWASAGAGLVGLSPPALAHATAIEPWAAGGTLLAGAALCALAVREQPRTAVAAGGGVLLAALPWLSPLLLVPAVPVGVVLAHWARTGGRRGGGLLPLEIVLGSLVFYATLNRGLYGGLVPDVVGTVAAPALPDRLPRLVGMWLDRDAGLLRWAPVLVLPWWSAWLLWRSRREGLARLLPARRDAEAAAGLAAAICAAGVLIVVLGRRGLDPAGFPGGTFAAALPAAGALCGWGMRHAPRLGAVLGTLTLATSGWLVVALRTGAAGSWDAPPPAPWGPLAGAFPRWDSGSAWEVAVTAAVGAAALALLVREWRARRR
jgi:hypothetical protein